MENNIHASLVMLLQYFPIY